MRQIRAPRFCFLYNNAIDAAQGRAGKKCAPVAAPPCQLALGRVSRLFWAKKAPREGKKQGKKRDRPFFYKKPPSG